MKGFEICFDLTGVVIKSSKTTMFFSDGLIFSEISLSIPCANSVRARICYLSLSICSYSLEYQMIRVGKGGRMECLRHVKMKPVFPAQDALAISIEDG